LSEKDIVGYVDLGRKPYCPSYHPPPMPDNKKLILVLKRAAKFFLSLLEKMERGEEV